MGNPVKQISGDEARALALEDLNTRHPGPAYHRIRLRGERGSLLWGYHEAATFKSWRIWKGQGRWQLSGRLAKSDAFQVRQRPLLFSAPRDRGMWAWGVERIEIKGSEVRAYLGEPEN